MKFAIQNILKSRWRWLYLLLTIGILLLIIVPLPRFDNPTSTVVLSVEKELLGARIAADGQWRFPKTDSIPDQYEKALLRYEDQWFYHHPGINPVALARAFLLNIKYKKVISGGSTLSMQVARLSRNNPPRNIPGKLLEMAMALKMEIFYSKKEILKLYASNAPFGGNVVGIDAASWRYFNRPAHQLSWAETATLAVLPNAPALIYPGKNQESLKKKRDHLLHRLLEDGAIDSMTYRISLAEPIPEKPKVLPDFADHAVNYLAQFHKGRKIISTLKSDWQKSRL